MKYLNYFWAPSVEDKINYNGEELIINEIFDEVQLRCGDKIVWAQDAIAVIDRSYLDNLMKRLGAKIKDDHYYFMGGIFKVPENADKYEDLFRQIRNFAYLKGREIVNDCHS